MYSVRQLLISGLLFAALPTAVLRGANSVEYVGGTVQSIPANSAGNFNFDDGSKLRFVYSGHVYELAYEQVTTMDITKAEGHHILHKIPVPSLNPHLRKETLAIHYKDPAGTVQTLNFELTADAASETQDTIALKKIGPGSVIANRSTDWWGDNYWKTNRNRSAWETGANGQAGASSPTSTK